MSEYKSGHYSNPVSYRIGRQIEVDVPRRSMYVMRGQARMHGVGNFEHSVKALTNNELVDARRRYVYLNINIKRNRNINPLQIYPNQLEFQV